MISYRRRKGTDVWHWCSNCSNWPTSHYDVRRDEPDSGKFCDECRSKDDNDDCS